MEKSWKPLPCILLILKVPGTFGAQYFRVQTRTSYCLCPSRQLVGMKMALLLRHAIQFLMSTLANQMPSWQYIVLLSLRSASRRSPSMARTMWMWKVQLPSWPTTAVNICYWRRYFGFPSALESHVALFGEDTTVTCNWFMMYTCRSIWWASTFGGLCSLGSDGKSTIKSGIESINSKSISWICS